MSCTFRGIIEMTLPRWAISGSMGNVSWCLYLVALIGEYLCLQCWLDYIWLLAMFLHPSALLAGSLYKVPRWTGNRSMLPVVQVWFIQKYYVCTPSSIQLGFEPMATRSWEYISYQMHSGIIFRRLHVFIEIDQAIWEALTKYSLSVET